ncbi:MAG: MerR family transcriptional regulator [Armatimonadetes bacterium JP3_11]|jgi:DNA-binding transcriptional MerR regulator|nr:MAG: MerR family transcriptional regulator [Armatimonadetes bacterium CP1_7O]OYT75349.1 MAG: MerR family transcriptional regulator [Armatimonadetes bacterium JP3_11]RMH06195.1 MAG: MerR family transcriptional regulator [Armatimonadota bacterium]
MRQRKRKSKAPVQERPVPISTASFLVGVETHTIRYWEREFAEFLNPVRTAGGQRRYRREDIEVLQEIKRLLKEELYTIAGAKRILSQKFGQRTPSEAHNGNNGVQIKPKHRTETVAPAKKGRKRAAG